jgi:hypothetical protein
MDHRDPTQNHACHGRTETPKVGEGRACQNWRTEPGLYSVRLQESCFPIATKTTKTKDKKKNKMKKTNKKNFKKEMKMPQYLGCALDSARRVCHTA